MNETTARQIGEDLAFVREALQRRRALGIADVALNVMWGAICMIGLILADFRLGWILGYWIVAGAAGWVTSVALGVWSQRRSGEGSGRRGRRETLHWGMFSVAVLALFFIGLQCGYHGWQLGQIALLLGGTASVLAGVHIDRSWLLPGLVLVAGAVASVYLLSHYIWTIVGVAVFVALTVGSLMRVRKREVPQEPV